MTRQFITGNSFLAGMQMSHAGVLKSIAQPYLTFRQEFGEKKPSRLDSRVSKKAYPERRLAWTIYPVYDPVFCVIAQGSKEVFLSNERCVYDPSHYLLVTAELPLVSRVLEASKKQPYLALRLELDPTLVGSVMVEAGHHSSQNHADVRPINVSSLDAGLLDAVVRLVRLLDAPAEVAFLAPLITREIIYRLWQGEQSDRLRHIAASGGYTPHITKAIERLHQDFDQPLRIEGIARELGISVSGFHHHFKAVTALSPLQFQSGCDYRRPAD